MASCGRPSPRLESAWHRRSDCGGDHRLPDVAFAGTDVRIRHPQSTHRHLPAGNDSSVSGAAFHLVAPGFVVEIKADGNLVIGARRRFRGPLALDKIVGAQTYDYDRTRERAKHSDLPGCASACFAGHAGRLRFDLRA